MRKILSKIAGFALGASMAFGAIVGLNHKVTEVNAADTWNLTDFSSLATNDVVVIADKTSSKAMSNNNGTGSAPSATAITLSSDKSQISGTPATTLQWTVTKNADGTLSFGAGSNKLYCTSANNGVRVGTNSANKFDIDSDFLHHTGTSRYLGVYNSQDWRCYTSINNNIKDTSIAFYKKTAEAGSPTLSVSPDSAHLLLNGSTTLTATALNGTGDVSWSIDDSSVASISASTGGSITVSAESIGAATVTASYSTAEDVKIKILVTEHNGTNSDPYTVVDAKAAIDAFENVSDAYVSGFISQIDSYNSTYHSITYWISDDGTKTNQLEVYSGKGLNNTDFSSVEDVELNARVTVFGNLKIYSSTYEFDKNNYIVSYTDAVKTLSSIALSGEYPTQFQVGDTFSYEGLIVTATYSNSTSSTVSGYTVSTPDMSTEGNKTITVSYTENGVTKEAEYSINVVSVLVKWTITFSPGTGSGTMEPVEVIDGESYTLPECTFTAPEGYIFEGWTVSGDIITVLENVSAHTEVTALWKVRPSEEEAPMDKGTNASDALIKFSAEDEGKSGLKVGTGSAGGDFTITVGANAKSISFYAAAWKGSTGTTLSFASSGVTFTPSTATITADDGATSNSPYTLTSSEETFKYVINFTEVSAETVITVTASARVIVWDAMYSLNTADIPTLVSITVNNPKTEYILNESFEKPTVTAYYSDETSKEVTDATFTGFDSSSVTDSLQISVSYMEDDVEVHTSYTISVSAPAPVATGTYKKVESNLSNFSGDYLIVYEDSEGDDWAFDGSLSTLDAVENRVQATINDDKIELSKAHEFHISNKEGGYSIQSRSGLYIGRTANSNGLDSNASDNFTNTITYNFGETNDMYIAGSGGAVLRYNSASNQNRFRFFKTDSYAGQKQISLYVQVEDAAQELALDILNLTSPVCNAEEKDFTSAWSTLTIKWNSLSTDEKNYLAEVKADANGTFVAEALARYDNICRTYGLTQFIEGRVVSAGSNLVQGMNLNNSSSTIVIVVVALTSISSIGVLLVIKRKRSLVK